MLEIVTSLAKANPMVAGAVAATGGGVILAQARELPKNLWKLFTLQFSTSVTVYSNDRAFEDFDRWLIEHPGTRKMRRLSIAEWYDNSNNNHRYGVAPGEGHHLVWTGNRPFLINRKIEGGPSQHTFERRRTQTLTVSTPGRSQQPILDLLDDIRLTNQGKNVVQVFYWEGVCRTLVDSPPKRSMATVFCNDALKRRLIDDLARFHASQDLYHQRGTPYRRGYLFKGPPGVGKTTMITALASHFDKSLYVLSASAIRDDRELLQAFNLAGDSYIVIEDIDSLRAAEARTTAQVSPTPVAVGQTGITLSGLLNAVDGIGARDGRVLFMTTNSPEVLDPALIRPGRIDVAETFEPASESEARAMFRCFYPNGGVDAFADAIRERLPISQAKLQMELLGGVFARFRER